MAESRTERALRTGALRETDAMRMERLRRSTAASEARRLARRPAEDSPRGYARIQAARAKRARRNTKRKREVLAQAVML